MRIDSRRFRADRDPVPPVVLVFGDEPLLVEEAGDAVRRAAVRQGCSEHVRYQAERGFDWNVLIEAGQSMSLFAERRLIDLRMPGKPGVDGGKVLGGLAESPPEDTILLVVCGRLETAVQKQKWFRTVEQHGLVVEAKPVRLAEFPSWLSDRMTSRGLHADRDSIALLTHYFEGNLLAAAQEIDRLALLAGEVGGDGNQYELLRQSVSDNARFNVFGYIDACLEGNPQRTLRMLDGMRAEGGGPQLVLWALARETRMLTRLAHELDRGGRQNEVFRRHRVWSSRQRQVSAALRRHGYAGWRAMLRQVARLDRIMKGREKGDSRDVWFDIERLSLRICGQMKG